MQVYLAGPLFSQGERAFNAELTAELERRGFSVFLPQRDAFDFDAPKFCELAAPARIEAIFATDRDNVWEADVLLFVLDGRVPDEGACVELGLAYAQQRLLKRRKLLVGLQTDLRGAFVHSKLNAMVAGALDEVVANVDDLVAVLQRFGAPPGPKIPAGMPR